MTRIKYTCIIYRKEEIILKGYSPKEVIEILLESGWYEKRIRGSHHQFEKKGSKNIVTVSTSKRTIPIGTLKNISKQSGIIFE